MDQIKEKNLAIKNIGNDYYGVAVLGELTNLTPDNIRLLKISASLGGAPGGAKPDQKENGKRTLMVDGVIRGNRLTLESSLAEYLMALKNSPLFDQPMINKRSIEQLNNETVMRFTAQLDLV